MSHGAFAEFLEIVFTFNRLVHINMHGTGTALSPLIMNLKQFWDTYPIDNLLVISMVFWGGWTCWRKWRSFTVCGILFWLMGMAAVILQGWYYAYQWIPVFSPHVLFFGFGVAALHRYQPAQAKNPILAKAGKTLAAPVAIMAIIITAYPSIENFMPTAAYALGKIEAHDYYRDFGHYNQGDFSLLAQVQVSEYVRKHSQKSDYIVVWGFEPTIYYLSGRRSATRFGFNYPLVATAGTPFYPRYRREFMRDVRRHKPVFIIILNEDINNLIVKSSNAYLPEFPELDVYIRREYRPAATIEHFDIRRRKDAPAPGG